MRLPNPLSSLAGLGGHLTGAVLRRRHVWVAPGRAHIEVKGVHRPGLDDVARHVEKALEELPAVHWAEVNAVLGTVVVSFDPDATAVDDFVGVVGAVEEAHGLHEEPFPVDRPELPGDEGALRRNALALVADVAGLGASLLGRALAVPVVPVEVASVVALVEHQPRVRALLEARVGYAATDLGLGLANALAQTITGGPLGLMVSLGHRVGVQTELVARRAAWERREPVLAGRRHDMVPDALAAEPRPVPLPGGPVERFADRLALASTGAFGLGLALTGSPRRAANMLVAGIPRASSMGREVFAASFGRTLAERDVVVLDRRVLRRIDRIDTVVLDGRILRAPRSEPTDARNGTDLDPMAAAVAASARAAGHLLVVVGGPAGLGRRLGADRVVQARADLADEVRALQAEGRVVLLVSGGSEHRALCAADCGVGVTPSGSPPPWGAHVLTAGGLADAWLMVEGSAAARDVSRRSAQLSVIGSGVGGAWALLGPSLGAGRRAVLPVQSAALAAEGYGLGAALLLERRRPRPARQVPSWHAMEGDEVLAALGSDPEGLRAGEADRRRLPTPPSRSLAVQLATAVAGELANPLTPVLGVGAGLAAAVGSVSDAVLVGGTVVANSVLSGAQRVRTELSIERLYRMSETFVTARRNRRPVELSSGQLVAGDVVELSVGDVVPADCRILEVTSCEVDESTLTGESLPVVKGAAPTPGVPMADRACMLYEGSSIVAGSVLAVVVAAGEDTEARRALADAPQPPPSGVEARLAAITRATIPVTVVGGGLVTALSLLRGRSVREAVGTGVSLTVAAVPEGLPLLATAAQLSAAQRLSHRNALVRNPRTIEALGRVDVLCFDKTGTLTAGRIALTRMSDGAHDTPVDELGPAGRTILAAALRASPRREDDGDVLPHATDEAVIEAAGQTGVHAGERIGWWRPLAELAFEPSRGFHAAVGVGADGALVSAKGAPESILPRCDRWRSPAGEVVLTPRRRAALDAEVERLAARGLRVLAVAERPSTARSDMDDDRVERMCLLGFLGLADHVRPTAAASVQSLRTAGVDVVMITGDHPSTAEAIADELSILGDGRTVTGTELDDVDDAELGGWVRGVSVFARVTPAHKVRIVKAFQDAGRVVAMTGDGANDAAAIRLADAGIALGRRGSPSAREAADLVVTDDRIETIVDAIVEGRAMWTSVQEALAILLGGNLGEIGFTLGATAVTGASPLAPRQLLLVNMLTDMLPATAIALRPPRHRSPEELLHEGPEASLGSALARKVALRAVTTAGGAATAWAAARVTGRRRRAGTVALVALVGTQLGQTAVSGGTSPVVLASTLASGAALVGIVQTPVVSQFFGCTPLGPVGWGIALGSSAAATAASVAVPWVLGRVGGGGSGR